MWGFGVWDLVVCNGEGHFVETGGGYQIWKIWGVGGGDGVLIVCRGLMVCACGRLLGSDKTPFNDLLALRWGMALLSGFGMIRGVGSSL